MHRWSVVEWPRIVVRHTLQSVVGDQSVLHPWHGFEDRVELALCVHWPGNHDVELDAVRHDRVTPELGVGLNHVDTAPKGLLLHRHR